MTTRVWAGRSLELLKPRRWSEKRPKFSMFLQKLSKKFINAFVTLLIIVIGIVIVILSFGVRVPLIHLPFGTNQTAQAAVVKPKVVIAPQQAVTTCSDSQADTLYTMCPTFSADYTNQQSGSINSNDFNVYTGAPVSNHEDEYYTDNAANIRVQDGALILEGQNQEDQGYDFTSAHVDTHGKEDFLYGKIVIRAQLPSGIGTWPAIWLLPSQPKYASLSPASDPDRYLNDGEIDVAEAVGTQPNIVYGVAHSLAYPENGTNRSYYSTIDLPTEYTAYQDYEVDWTPTSLTFSVNGQPYFTYKKVPGAGYQSWPFNQPFYLVMNLALGGTWAGSDTKQFPGNGIDKSALPASMKIQSVNYYSYTGPQ